MNTIIDHIENIVVPGNGFENPSNEYWALVCLRQGMDFLYQQASKLDDATIQILNPNNDLQIVGTGNIPGTENIPKELLTCSFHWYAISACQYVRTVGALVYLNDNTRPIPPEYVKTVIPEVLEFRDKVAAHFAWTSQNARDNDAERLASIVPPLSFVNNSWQVGAFTVTRTSQGVSSNSQAIQPWSLCEVHKKLTQRYWPGEQQ